MVEYTLQLDSIFHSLSDATRRDILRRVARQELTISEIAVNYNLTFAAISKHLKVLERAKLIAKRRRGKEQIVSAVPSSLKNANQYLRYYEKLWNDRFDRLESILITPEGENHGEQK